MDEQGGDKRKCDDSHEKLNKGGDGKDYDEMLGLSWDKASTYLTKLGGFSSFSLSSINQIKPNQSWAESTLEGSSRNFMNRVGGKSPLGNESVNENLILFEEDLRSNVNRVSNSSGTLENNAQGFEDSFFEPEGFNNLFGQTEHQKVEGDKFDNGVDVLNENEKRVLSQPLETDSHQTGSNSQVDENLENQFLRPVKKYKVQVPNQENLFEPSSSLISPKVILEQSEPSELLTSVDKPNGTAQPTSSSVGTVTPLEGAVDEDNSILGNFPIPPNAISIKLESSKFEFEPSHSNFSETGTSNLMRDSNLDEVELSRLKPMKKERVASDKVNRPFKVPRKVEPISTEQSYNPDISFSFASVVDLETSAPSIFQRLSDGTIKHLKPNSNQVGNGLSSLTKLYQSSQKLPNSFTKSELQQIGVPNQILEATFSTAESFTFADSCGLVWGLPEAIALMRTFQCKKLHSSEVVAWTTNHYKHIVWKLICLARSYPEQKLKDLNRERVILELKYRLVEERYYNRESALSNIVDQRTSSWRYFVAFICTIAMDEEKDSRVKVEISDGWYSLPCTFDTKLLEMAKNKQLKVGDKIGICAAKLESPGPLPILEVGDSVRLNVHYNGCRLAKFDSQLGYQVQPCFPIRISNIRLDGGTIPLLNVILVEKSPIQVLVRNTSTNVNQVLPFNDQFQDKARRYTQDSSLDVSLFFKVQVMDKFGFKASITFWSCNLDQFESFQEVQHYQFLNLTPAKRKGFALNDAEVHLTYTKASTFYSLSRSNLLGCVVENLKDELTSAEKLMTEPKDWMVSMALLYLGAGLNGYIFVNQALKPIVIMPPPKYQSSFAKLKPFSAVVVGDVKIGEYYPSFHIQTLSFNYQSNVNLKFYNVIYQSKLEELKLWYFSNRLVVDKLVEQSQIAVDLNTQLESLEKKQLRGKFIDWKWELNKVTTQFQPNPHSQPTHIQISLTRYFLLFCQSFSKNSFDRFIKKIAEGAFILNKEFEEEQVKSYLEKRMLPELSEGVEGRFNYLKELLYYTPKSKLPTYQLFVNHTVHHQIYLHEQTNLFSYLKDMVQMLEFEVELIKLETKSVTTTDKKEMFWLDSVQRTKSVSTQTQT